VFLVCLLALLLLLLQMCFRGLLSTSNIISSDTIEVTTDEDLLWITAVGDTVLRSSSSSRP
jgi:hypothetical protein